MCPLSELSETRLGQGGAGLSGLAVFCARPALPQPTCEPFSGTASGLQIPSPPLPQSEMLGENLIQSFTPQPDFTNHQLSQEHVCFSLVVIFNLKAFFTLSSFCSQLPVSQSIRLKVFSRQVSRSFILWTSKGKNIGSFFMKDIENVLSSSTSCH